MKAEELRLNNLVNNDGELQIVKSIQADNIRCEGMNTDDYDPLDLTPIELNLKKIKLIGFQQGLKNKEEYWISINNYNITLKVTDISIYFMVNWMQSKEIEFVHQLQNLIYELTSKELDVSKL